jgi:ATP-binding cassette subfamily B protein
MSTSKKSITNLTLAYFWQRVWHYRRYTIGVFISEPLTVLVDAYLPPIILATVLNRLAKGDFAGHDVWKSFGVDLIGYTILILIGSIGYRIVDAFGWRLEANIERDIAQDIYGHLVDQSANFHANHFGGSLVSQSNKLMGSYIRFADTTIYQVIPLFSALIFVSIILAHRAPLYVAVLLVFSICFMIGGFIFSRKTRRLSALQATEESKQTGYLADSVTNIMAIKSFAGGRYERRRFSDITKITRDGTLAIGRASQRQMNFLSFFSRLISASALVMAVIAVVVFKANVATAFLIFSYTGSIVSQLFLFCNSSLRNYNRVFGDASDMIGILQEEPEIKDPVHPEKVRMNDGSISFKNVNFTHDGANDALFHNLSIDIRAGEKVGLVGHSGSGKTTFTRLLLRFSDIDGGAILIDGQNIAAVTQDDLRSHIAYVPQEPIMFHRSLMENIRYGQLDADDAAAIKAAKVAHAHEFILELPEGYDTLVGERDCPSHAEECAHFTTR